MCVDVFGVRDLYPMCISKPFFCSLGLVLRCACQFLKHNNMWVWCSSCWAKRRLSMAWRFNQLDANRHNRFDRGVTFHGGGRFMHRYQSTCGQVVRFRKDSIVFLSRFDCLMVVCASPIRVKMQGWQNFCMSWWRGFSCHFNSGCCGGALLFMI